MKTLEFIRTHFKEAVLEEHIFCGQESVDIKKDWLIGLLKSLKDEGFEVLMDLTGVDYLFPDAHTKVVYLLHNPANYKRMRINVFAKRDESLPSVIELWEGADWYERELYDLFGVCFTGHPDLKRILMPDDWKGHPLRKDYPLTEEPVEFKHGVKPKIPSQIIPNVKERQKP